LILFAKLSAHCEGLAPQILSMKQSVKISEIFPKEHGAWAILLVPFCAGAWASENPGFPTLILLICVVSLYLLRGAMEFYFSSPNKMGEYRDVTFFYYYVLLMFILFLLAASILFFYFKLFNLSLLGSLAFVIFVFYYFLVFQKKINRISQQLIALLGLTLTAPAAYYVTTGKWDSKVLLLWILHIAFFQVGFLYVHHKIGIYKNRREIKDLWDKLLFSRNLVAGWCISIGIFYSLFLAGLIHSAYFIALVPITAHIFAGIFLDKKELNIKKMGYLLVGQNIFFLVILLYLFRT